jgi:Tol biopolymer transport system component
MWSDEKTAGARRFKVSAAIAAAVLAATVVVLVTAATKPAEAAFPGSSGAIAYTSSQDGDLDVWRMAPDGFGATNLTDEVDAQPTYADSLPAWSAEGTQIAFVSQRNDGDGTNDQDIYRMNAAGNGERQLTTDLALDLEPSWFPDETRIAFRRNALTGTDANIWILTLDENGQPTGEQQLTDDPTSDIMPAVSPNGKLIAFASNRDGDFEIYVMKAAPESATNVPRKLTKNTRTNTSDPNQMRDWNPDWSPSGKQIVFESNRDGDDEIFVMNADGTRQKNLTKNDTFNDIDPVFSPDGRKIAFERFNPTGSFRDIYRMRADGTRKANLTESPTTTDANPSWQPMP